MHFYANEQLSGNKYKTPEGFLLLTNVPLARTGTMIYGPGETKVPVGPDGAAYISRNAEDLFRPETMASFQGKAITDDHPPDDVGPANWSAYSKGVALNIRPGEDADQDKLLGDLLVTERSLINKIDAGLVEISLGYDAQYATIEPGQGVQKNIVGNHVAFVERGRCGPSCRVRDSERQDKTKTKDVKMTIRERLLSLFNAGDKEGFTATLARTTDAELTAPAKTEDALSMATNKELEDLVTAKVRDAMTETLPGLITAAVTAAFKTTDGTRRRTRDEEPDDETEEEREKRERAEDKKTKDRGKRTRDEKEDDKDEEDEDEKGEKTKDAMKDLAVIRSRAEILAPSLSLPTLDSKPTYFKVRDCMCAMQRKALSHAFKDGKTAVILAPLGQIGGVDFDNMPRATLDTVFVAASEMMKQHNNASQSAGTGRSTFGDFKSPTVGLPAQINSWNREAWGARQAQVRQNLGNGS